MANTSDVASLPNPYDFSHPVTNPEIFIGRRDIIDEIRYYLDHAAIDARPMSLAILGPRAAGKTSLLNMIEFEAGERGYCVARVNLNESDVEHELAFLFKLFDEILTAAIEVELPTDLGETIFALGGRDGVTYEAYLDMVHAYDLPENRRLRPFGFPVIYAKSMASGNLYASVSDGVFSRDLKAIQAEVNRPIVVLIDEGNVLATSRVLLQKLRNMFMHLPGYMLVISGTPDIFPVMDDIFSPISRDFKRFMIGRFESGVEAEECVLNPLRSIGFNHPIDIIVPETLTDLTAPQGLTEANPYQIQLICHFLFRNMQSRHASMMTLNLDVLDDVLNELGHGQDFRDSSVMQTIRLLTDSELSLLGKLCGTSGKATLEQIWYLHHVVYGDQGISKVELEQALERFAAIGLISTIDGKVRFLGDERETIYAKYYARKRGIRQLVKDSAPGVAVALGTQARLRSRDRWIPMATPLTTTTSIEISPDFVDQVVNTLLHGTDVESLNNTADNWLSRGVVSEFYRNFVQLCLTGIGSVNIAKVHIEGPWIDRQVILMNTESSEDSCVELRSKADELQQKSVEFSIEYSVDIQRHSLPAIEEMTANADRLEKPQLRSSFGGTHQLLMHRAYVTKRDRTLANLHRSLSLKFNSEPTTVAELNNLGYSFLVEGDTKRAEPLLEKARQVAHEAIDVAIAEYNLGIAALVRKDYPLAIQRLEQSLEASALSPLAEEPVGCLLVPINKDGELVIEERWRPNVVELGNAAMQVVTSFLKASSDEQSDAD